MNNLYMLNEIYTANFFYGILNIISILAVLCGISVIVAKNPIVSVLFLIGLFFSIASYLMMLGLNFIGLSYLLVYVGAVSILFLFILMLINVRISELVTDNSNSFVLGILISIFLFTPIKSKGSLLGSEIIFDNTRSGLPNKLFFGSNEDTNNFYAINPHIQPEKLQETQLGTNIDVNTDVLNQTGFISDLINLFNSIYYTNIDVIFFVTSKIWDGALGESTHMTAIGNILYTNYPIWLILTSIILLLAMVGAIIITIKQ